MKHPKKEVFISSFSLPTLCLNLCGPQNHSRKEGSLGALAPSLAVKERQYHLTLSHSADLV